MRIRQTGKFAGFDRLQSQMVAAVRKSLAANGGGIRIPEAGRLFWGWFTVLSATRGVGPAGAQPLQLTEIEAFARLHGWPIEARHVRLLLEMDRAFLAGVGAHRPRAANAPSADLTTDIFDAVF